MTSKKQRGFTLIELMLAMTFIAFLLLFTVAAVLQVTRIYVKGSAIRQIDQTGRQLVDDVSMALRTGTTPRDGGTGSNRLCVGGTSYLWNTVTSNNPDNKYSDSPGETLRFVSIQDQSGSLCGAELHSPVLRKAVVDLVGPEITPLSFSVTKHGRLWDISLVLSTAGDNVAIDNGSGGFMCEPKNQFCALGNFETSVYSRGGE